MRPVRTYIKDPFPGLSHFFGAALSIVAIIVLVRASAGKPVWIAAFSVYGACMFLLYTASGLCHSIHCRPSREKWLDRCDYMAIFLLIAGTYTPVCVIGLGGTMGWVIVTVEWLIAAGGIAWIASGHEMTDLVRAVLYIGMGWLAIVAAAPLLRTLSTPGMAWLIGGGIVYSVGAVVFVLDRPHLIPGWFHAHDLWHCMVLTGSACHFCLMLSLIAR